MVDRSFKQPIRFDVILVDLDNTLYDFAKAQKEGCRAGAELLGNITADDLTNALLFTKFGPEAFSSFHQVLSMRGEKEEMIMKVFRAYEKAKEEAIVAFPDIINTFNILTDAGIKIIVITNSSVLNARNRSDKIGVSDYISGFTTPDTCGYAKPSPEIFIAAISTISSNCSRICMVGDNLTNDIKPAANLGIITVHARYGDKMPPEFCKGIIPDYTIDRFFDLTNIVFS